MPRKDPDTRILGLGEGRLLTPQQSWTSRDHYPPQDQVSKDKALQSMASMSSAQIVSASVLQNKFSPPSPLPQAVFSTSSRVWVGCRLGAGLGCG